MHLEILQYLNTLLVSASIRHLAFDSDEHSLLGEVLKMKSMLTGFPKVGWDLCTQLFSLWAKKQNLVPGITLAAGDNCSRDPGGGKKSKTTTKQPSVWSACSVILCWIWFVKWRCSWLCTQDKGREGEAKHFAVQDSSPWQQWDLLMRLGQSLQPRNATKTVWRKTEQNCLKGQK